MGRTGSPLTVLPIHVSANGRDDGSRGSDGEGVGLAGPSVVGSGCPRRRSTIRPVNIEFDKVEAELANVELLPDPNLTDVTPARRSVLVWEVWVPEEGSVLVHDGSAGHEKLAADAEALGTGA
jgi:hypothetical protein